LRGAGLVIAAGHIDELGVIGVAGEQGQFGAASKGDAQLMVGHVGQTEQSAGVPFWAFLTHLKGITPTVWSVPTTGVLVKEAAWLLSAKATSTLVGVVAGGAVLKVPAVTRQCRYPG